MFLSAPGCPEEIGDAPGSESIDCKSEQEGADAHEVDAQVVGAQELSSEVQNGQTETN